MFGKHFASMYERSMVGSGAMVFAVMGYVIANARPSIDGKGFVTLNPSILGPILGESPADVADAIKFLCSPDPKSKSKEEEGRRLVQVSEYEFLVVNFKKYRGMRDPVKRREQNRDAQRRRRGRKRGVKCRPDEIGLADVNSHVGNGEMPVEPEDVKF